MQSVRAAVVQMCSRGNPTANLQRATTLVEQAAAAGARLIALPENFGWLRIPGAAPAPVAPLPGPLVEGMQAVARATGCTLILGSVQEAPPDDDPRHYNTAVVLGPDGALLGAYRKRHLFDVELPEARFRESDLYLPGEAPVCVQAPAACVGLSICYDLRFPEHYRALVDLGAEILTVPSAFTTPTGRAHWHTLVRARAIENQCFMLAPNQWGHHGGPRDSYGHSLIVDPWGEVLAEVAEGEGIAVADLDAERLATVRRQLPALDHRRG